MEPNLGAHRRFTGDRPQARREEGSASGQKEPTKLASSAPGGERSSEKLSFVSSINVLCAFGLSRSQSDSQCEGITVLHCSSSPV